MITFGRAADNDVVIANDTVSNRHAVIEKLPDGLSIRDLGSTNGTFVNGTRIKQATITEGDAVRLGAAHFTVQNGSLTPSEAPTTQLPRSLFLIGGLALVAVVVGAAVVMAGNGDSSPTQSANYSETASPQQSQTDPFSPPDDLGSLVSLASNSVISIDCAEGSGSGWPIQVGNDVLVVSNHHVVADCIGSTVEISNSSIEGSARVVSSHEATDLAVLSTTTRLAPLKTATPPPVGAWLMVAGNPLGLERSVSYGTLTNSLEGLLITDAAINPGNSGGPVFDSDGQVVAIASAKISDESVDRIGILIEVEELCVAVLNCNGAFPG